MNDEQLKKELEDVLVEKWLAIDPNARHMKGVRSEEENVTLLSVVDGREVVVAFNEAGHAQTSIDVRDLIAWLKEHRPDLLQ